nr:ECF transporter S component [Candidatus Sigynarchaeota archaeon]
MTSQASPEIESGVHTREVAVYAIFSALMVVLTLLLIPVPQPIQFIGFAPVLIYVLGILLKPWRAFVVCSVGSVIGQLLASMLLGDYATLPVYLLGAFVARGLEGLLISALEKYVVRMREPTMKQRYARELWILLIGGAWEFAGYYIVGGPYYLITSAITMDVSLLWYLPVLIDLVFIPVAIAVIFAIRRNFQQEYLDRLLFLDKK